METWIHGDFLVFVAFLLKPIIWWPAVPVGDSLCLLPETTARFRMRQKQKKYPLIKFSMGWPIDTKQGILGVNYLYFVVCATFSGYIWCSDAVALYDGSINQASSRIQSDVTLPHTHTHCKNTSGIPQFTSPLEAWTHKPPTLTTVCVYRQV